MRNASTCPPTEMWHDYIRDWLSPTTDSALTEHIQSCRTCEQSLASLIAPLHPSGRKAPSNHAPPAELVERLQGLWSAEAAHDNPGAAWPELRGYEILGVLGKGGMGVVYRARQLDLDREVAVKMLAPGGPASALDARRLRTDATTAAKLVHPHVVSVYDVGEYRGEPFFVMELISGGSLAQQLPALIQSPREAVRLIAQAARALDYAHHRGICHRDVKPANIMLRPRHLPDPWPEPAPRAAPVAVSGCDACVADFGVAKRSNEESGLTLDGAVIGTPGYIAPEQIRSERPSPAADVYGLGAVLYECLTGLPPFRGATPFDTLLLTLQQEAVRPRVLNYRLPRDLETVCLKALEKDPGLRYTSAAALADDLERWLRGEPVRARHVGSLARGWRWCRRKPLIPGFVAALVLAVAGGLLGSVWMWRKASANEAQAVASLHKEEEARREAEDQFAILRTTVTNSVAGSSPEFRSAQFHSYRQTMLQEADDSLIRLLERQPKDSQLQAIRARVLTQLGTIHFTQNQNTKAVAAFERAVAIWEQVPDAPGLYQHRAWRAISHTCLEQACAREGREDRAQQCFETAFQIWQRMVQDRPELADNLFPAVVNMNWLLLGNELPDPGAPKRFQKLRERLARMHDTEECAFFFGLLRLEYFYHRIESHLQLGDKSGVPTLARETATFITEALSRPSQKRGYLIYAIRQSHKVCFWLRHAGLTDEALVLATRTARSAQQLLQDTPGDPNRLAQLSDSWHAVSKVHSDLNQIEEAIEASRNALHAHRKLADALPNNEYVRLALGSRHLQLGRKLCVHGAVEAAAASFSDYQALWPGDPSKHAEALRELRKWAKEAQDEGTPESRESCSRYLELCARLEKQCAPEPAGSRK